MGLKDYSSEGEEKTMDEEVKKPITPNEIKWYSMYADQQKKLHRLEKAFKDMEKWHIDRIRLHEGGIKGCKKNPQGSIVISKNEERHRGGLIEATEAKDNLNKLKKEEGIE